MRGASVPVIGQAAARAFRRSRPGCRLAAMSEKMPGCARAAPRAWQAPLRGTSSFGNVPCIAILVSRPDGRSGSGGRSVALRWRTAAPRAEHDLPGTGLCMVGSRGALTEGRVDGAARVATGSITRECPAGLRRQGEARGPGSDLQGIAVRRCRSEARSAARVGKCNRYNGSKRH